MPFATDGRCSLGAACNKKHLKPCRAYVQGICVFGCLCPFPHVMLRDSKGSKENVDFQEDFQEDFEDSEDSDDEDSEDFENSENSDDEDSEDSGTSGTSSVESVLNGTADESDFIAIAEICGYIVGKNIKNHLMLKFHPDKFAKASEEVKNLLVGLDPEQRTEFFVKIMAYFRGTS
jgi:hypothetical protein